VGEPISFTLQLTNSDIVTNTFIIEVAGPVTSALKPSQPFTLVAGTSLRFTVVVTPLNDAPQEETADTSVPTVITIRSVDNPKKCRQLQVTTRVFAWQYSQRLLIIGKH
jgi:hypothetical protein